jgi:hypothetical protein
VASGKQHLARWTHLKQPNTITMAPTPEQTADSPSAAIPKLARPKRQRPSPAPNPQVDELPDPTDSDKNSEDDTDNESTSDIPRPVVGTSEFPVRSTGRIFPCPFSLRNPQGRPCRYRNMRSPRSVEKHLFLQHQQDPFCPICGLTFVTQSACDSHVVSRSCERTNNRPVIEGLTQTQIRNLSQCLDSGSKVGQYYAMWEVVHPGVQPPVLVSSPGSRRLVIYFAVLFYLIVLAGY